MTELVGDAAVGSSAVRRPTAANMRPAVWWSASAWSRTIGCAAPPGLACDRGIIVDDCSRTSDPRSSRPGTARARRLPDGRLLRLESVQNAVEQGKSAAAALMGRERPFRAAPWFWSDQFDIKLQMVGLSHGYDQVVTRGDSGQAGVLGVLFPRRPADRGRFAEPHPGSHAGQAAARSRPVADARSRSPIRSSSCRACSSLSAEPRCCYWRPSMNSWPR